MGWDEEGHVKQGQPVCAPWLFGALCCAIAREGHQFFSANKKGSYCFYKFLDFNWELGSFTSKYSALFIILGKKISLCDFKGWQFIVNAQALVL